MFIVLLTKFKVNSATLCVVQCVVFWKWPDVVCSVDFLSSCCLFLSIWSTWNHYCHRKPGATVPSGAERRGASGTLQNCFSAHAVEMQRLTRMEAIFSGVHNAGASWRRRVMWKLQVRLKKQTTLRRRNLCVCEFVWGQEKVLPHSSTSPSA